MVPEVKLATGPPPNKDCPLDPDADGGAPAGVVEFRPNKLDVFAGAGVAAVAAVDAAALPPKMLAGFDPVLAVSLFESGAGNRLGGPTFPPPENSDTGLPLVSTRFSLLFDAVKIPPGCPGAPAVPNSADEFVGLLGSFLFGVENKLDVEPEVPAAENSPLDAGVDVLFCPNKGGFPVLALKSNALEASVVGFMLEAEVGVLDLLLAENNPPPVLPVVLLDVPNRPPPLDPDVPKENDIFKVTSEIPQKRCDAPIITRSKS